MLIGQNMLNPVSFVFSALCFPVQRVDHEEHLHCGWCRHRTRIRPGKLFSFCDTSKENKLLRRHELTDTLQVEFWQTFPSFYKNKLLLIWSAFLNITLKIRHQLANCVEEWVNFWQTFNLQILSNMCFCWSFNFSNCFSVKVQGQKDHWNGKTYFECWMKEMTKASTFEKEKYGS